MTNIEHYASNKVAADIKTIDAKPIGVDQIVADLIETMRKHTKTAGENWNAETTMTDVGIDSFDFVELVFEIEDKYDINMNFNANMSMEELSTVGDIARAIANFIAKEGRTA